MGILRVLLALSVLLSHSGPVAGIELVGGKVAVQSFFIISGFYMSLILNEKYVGEFYNYKLFISNRFLRIFPLYWIIFVCVIIVSALFFLLSNGDNLLWLSPFKQYVLSTGSMCYAIASNLLIFGLDGSLFLKYGENGHFIWTDNFLNSTPPVYLFVLIPQAWSLSLELYFYLLAPFILRRGIKLVVILFLLSFILRLVLYHIVGLKFDPWTYRFFFTELFFFLAGAFAYRLLLYIRKNTPPKIVMYSVLALVLLFTSVFALIPAYTSQYFPFSLKETFYFITITLSIPYLFLFFKDKRWDNYIGELSFPIYTAHLMIWSVVNSLIPSSFVPVVTVILSILFAACLLKYISEPIDRYRQQRILQAGKLNTGSPD